MQHPFVRLLPAVGIVALSTLLPLTALAQSVDVPDWEEDAAPSEPTPIEEIAPSGEGEVIPGTEPLYDKGVTVTEIEITGNKLVSDEMILKAIGTQPGSLYSKRRLQSDLKKIFEMGYFTDRLRVVPIATREGVHLRIEVEENPVVHEVTFEGVTMVKVEDLSPLFESQIEMPQNVNLINQGIQAIEDRYKAEGYILARVEDIQEDPPGHIKLKVNEGTVNNISFSGNTKTKDYVIRRAMAQKEGEVYNEKTVSEDMKRIFGTQTFSDVRRVVKASPTVPGAYDLVIEVDEKKTGAISLGGGVDTGTGVFGSVGYNDPNWLGRGQNVSATFSLGTGVLGGSNFVVQRRIIQSNISWFTPSLAETTNSLGVNMYGRDLGSFNVPLSLERRIGGQVNWGRPLETMPGASVSLGLGFEDVNMREGSSARTLRSFGISPADRREQLEDGTFAFLAPEAVYDSRDNRFNPSSGWLNSVGSRLAWGIQNNSYGTVATNLRRYLKITDDVTFALNAQGGGNVFGDIPDFNAFRLGGAWNLRGFQEGGVGIGQQYLLGSAELRSKIPFLKAFRKFPIYDMVQGVLFVDAGTLFDESSSNDAFQRPGEAVSVGGGVRVNVPAVGPLRIDWAQVLGDAGRQRRRFNFGVGQKF